MTLNIAYMVRESAKSYPAKPALLFEGGSLTFSEVDRLSDRLAAGLRARGLRPADRVALQLPNLPQFVIAYFGVLKLGGVVVPMNVQLTTPELVHQLADSGSRALIVWSGSLPQAAPAAATVGVEQLFVVQTPGTPTATTGTPFEELLRPLDRESPAPLHPCEAADTAVLIYTSGTTGRPKGAELTHFQLLMNADTPGRLFGIRDDDVVLVALPLFHVFGLSSQLNVCMRFGATMSLVTRFDPARVLEVIQRDRVTVFEGVPTMFLALLHHPEIAEEVVSSLRVGISGGASLPAEVLNAFEERFGITILEGYGLTETASTTTFNISAEERKPYSVGKPIWGVDIQIWDDKDVALPPGPDHIGEIVVRGVNVMKGYHNQPEATEQAFTDGWFRTGDLGYIDDDGFLFIVDRLKDLIIRGGYNVYPREIEEALYQHPAVKEGAVIGVPDERLGEEVKAFVVLHPGADLSADDLITFLRERLAAYKYPRIVEFRSELPHGSTGKVLKTALH